MFEESEFVELQQRGLGWKVVDNPLVSTYFSNSAAIDFIYERARLPTPIVQRTLKAIRKIKFLNLINEAVYSVTDRLIHPSVGVSVRSWSASHEKIDATMSAQFGNLGDYQSLITCAINLEKSKSLLIAFDNTQIALQFQPFLHELEENRGIQIITFDSFTLRMTPLQRSAIHLLALSKTNVLIGNSKSTFLECIYWFGELKQKVILVDVEATCVE